jgi:hypothetical protein
MHFSTAECVVEVEVVEDKVIEVPDNSTTTTNSTDAEKDSNSKDKAADAKSDKDQSAEDKKSEKDASTDEEKSEQKADGDKEGADKEGEKAGKGERLAGGTAHMVFTQSLQLGYLCRVVCSMLWAARTLAAVGCSNVAWQSPPQTPGLEHC